MVGGTTVEGFALWRWEWIRHIPGAGLRGVGSTLRTVAKLSRAVYGWQDSTVAGLNCEVSLRAYHSASTKLSHVGCAKYVSIDMYEHIYRQPITKCGLFLSVKKAALIVPHSVCSMVSIPYHWP